MDRAPYRVIRLPSDPSNVRVLFWFHVLANHFA